MNRFSTIALLALAFVVVASSAATLAQAAVPTSATDPKLLWNKEFGFSSQCTPLLFNDNKQMYVASGTKFGVLDTSTGDVVSTASDPNAFLANAIVKVGDSKVAYNNRFSITCRDATSLKLEWNLTLGGDKYFNGAPVYLPSESAVFATTEVHSTLFKIDGESGKVLWEVFLGGNVSRDDVLPTMTFSKANNLLIVPAATALHAVRPGSGEVVWSDATIGRVSTTPVLSQDESTFFISTNEGVVYNISTLTGNGVYLATGESIINTPSLVDDVLYFGGQKRCFALDVKTFEYKWKFDSPIVAFGTSRVYEDTVIFGAYGHPFALHRKDGSVAWNATSLDFTFYRGIAAPTSDGKLFMTSVFGHVYALQLPRSTPPPVAPIYEEQCLTSSDCSGSCVKEVYAGFTCVKTGPKTSILRQCAETRTEAFVTEFTNSSSCETGTTAKELRLVVGICYPHSAGGSFKITGCTPMLSPPPV